MGCVKGDAMILCRVCGHGCERNKEYSCEVCGGTCCHVCCVSLDLAFMFRYVCKPCSEVSPGPSMLSFKKQVEMKMAECCADVNRLIAIWRSQATYRKEQTR